MDKIIKKNLKIIYNADELKSDSIVYRYQINYFLDSARGPIIINGKIVDIYKQSEDYFILISLLEKNDKNHLYGLIKLNNKLVGKLNQEIRGRNSRGYFLLNSSSYRNSSQKLVDVSKNNQVEQAVMNRDSIFKFDGDLVDFIIIPQKLGIQDIRRDILEDLKKYDE